MLLPGHRVLQMGQGITHQGPLPAYVKLWLTHALFGVCSKSYSRYFKLGLFFNSSEPQSQTDICLARISTVHRILHEALGSIIVTNIKQYNCNIRSYSRLAIKYK